MKTALYNPAILQDHASDLYKQAGRLEATARVLVFWKAVKYAGLWFIGTGILLSAFSFFLDFAYGKTPTYARPQNYMAGLALENSLQDDRVKIALVFLVIGALVGYELGNELRARAAELRITAQTALCQRQIEFNTRAGVTSESTVLPA